MTVIVVDGPEASGKTTIIREIVKIANNELHTETVVREWGPVEGWYEYVIPFEDARKDEDRLHVWSRSWASEIVYNDLLMRGRHIDELSIYHTFESHWMRSDALLVMVEAPVHVLERRRSERVAEGGKPDLPIAPGVEMAVFRKYGEANGWMFVSGNQNPQDAAIEIMERLK